MHFTHLENPEKSTPARSKQKKTNTQSLPAGQNIWLCSVISLSGESTKRLDAAVGYTPYFITAERWPNVFKHLASLREELG